MRRKLVFIILILLMTAILSGCTGGAIRGTSWAGLTATEETAYLADGSFVFAVSLNEGKEVWRYPEQANQKQQFFAAPAITSDGLVIVGSSGADHLLAAIDPKDINPDTGSPAEAWKFTGAKGQWMAPPLVLDEKLFAPNGDGNLYILNLTDGRSVKEAEKIIELGGRLWSQPVTDGERVFVTSLDHSVFALDTVTYEVIWHIDLASAIPGSPVVGTDGNIYVGTLDSHFEKIDPTTGSHKTVLTTNGWLWGTPVVDGNNIYLADLTGVLYSFDTQAGDNTWTSVKPDGAITASPLVLPDSILFVTESGETEDDPGNLFAISREGKILWSKKLGGTKVGKIYTTPVYAGGKILVAPLGADGYLYAYNSDGSEVTWSPFTPEK